jgi:ATP-dependent Lon protease
MPVLNDLDVKLLEHFRGYVVKKDLVRTVKVGANVPVFVLEYLIANSCSTEDDEKIKIGMDNVKKVLSEHFVNPDESSLIHSKIREKGRYKVIDKISVELDSKKDQYWAKLLNSNIRNGNITDSLVQQHEKMLMGGIWAIIDIEYDPEIKIGNNIFPFVIVDIKPIQLSSFDNSKIINNRKEFTKEEWLDILLRSCGYEPSAEGVRKE